MNKKKESPLGKIKADLEKVVEEHREIKSDLLTLMGKFEQPNMTKEKLKDELWILYQKIK